MPAAKKKAAKTATKRTTAKKAAPKKSEAKKTTAKKKAAPRKAAAKVTKAVKKIAQKPQTTQKAMEKTMTKGTNQFDAFANDASAMSRDNIEALMKCGNIWMKGCEDMIQASTSMMQDAAQKQNEYIKQAMSAKTLNEFAETQNKIAQASYDDLMQSATKITELGIKVLTDAAEPFNDQMAKTMKKASQTVCA